VAETQAAAAATKMADATRMADTNPTKTGFKLLAEKEARE
jgi:hypothetical protein